METAQLPNALSSGGAGRVDPTARGGTVAVRHMLEWRPMLFLTSRLVTSFFVTCARSRCCRLPRRTCEADIAFALRTTSAAKWLGNP